ncbi:MAG TPA: 4'-phosphopantetheinyl transferase superfamily protein [Gemmatales bacterium]|nr:4'-phosphopantetheinyl transferase superfamily protein [Gemmatales bacterium]
MNPLAATSLVPAGASTAIAATPCDIWQLPDDACLGDPVAATTTAEQAQAARMVQPDRARLFLRLRAAMRTILSQYVGLPPAEIPLEQAPAGKPHLTGAAACWQFNFSHTRGLAILAVAHGRSLGVDIECTRQEIDDAAIARRFFSSREQAFLSDHQESASRLAAFFALWTRKEAYLKEGGRGLAGNLSKVEASCWPQAGGPLPDEDKAWLPLPLPPGFVGALVAAGTSPLNLVPPRLSLPHGHQSPA